MSKKENPYVRQMVEALALIHLTRRTDVVVSPPEVDSGLDFLVKVAKRNSTPRRTLGVIVKGTSDRIESEDQATKILNSMEKKWKIGVIPMPVCLFLFSVHDNDGYYDWKVEPVIKNDMPKLVPHATFHCKKLDTDAMDEIMDTVDKWHKALYRSFVS